MNTLYLVRHGENFANLTKEFSHRKVDYSLTAKGILQAEQTAAYFRDQPIDAIYTSPLKRARETAALIGQAVGRTPVALEEFREVNVGSLEGRPPTAELWAQHHTIMTGWLAHNRRELAFPDGEDHYTLVGRIRAGIETIFRGQDGSTAILVAHGGLFGAAIAHLCRDLDPAVLFRQEFGNCGIAAITLDTRPPGWLGELRHWGLCDHLSGEAAALISAMPQPL